MGLSLFQNSDLLISNQTPPDVEGGKDKEGPLNGIEGCQPVDLNLLLSNVDADFV
jgi:hypothetical protein